LLRFFFFFFFFALKCLTETHIYLLLLLQQCIRTIPTSISYTASASYDLGQDKLWLIVWIVLMKVIA